VRAGWQERQKTLPGLHQTAATRPGSRWQSGSAGELALLALVRYPPRIVLSARVSGGEDA